MCTNETAAHNFCNACNETLGVATLTNYFAKDYLSTGFCKQFCYENPYSKEVGECQQVSLMRSQTKRGLFVEALFKAVS